MNPDDYVVLWTGGTGITPVFYKSGPHFDPEWTDKLASASTFAKIDQAEGLAGLIGGFVLSCSEVGSYLEEA